MSSSRRIKPTFGREMEPCLYEMKWANKLSKNEVIAIKAEPNIVKEDRTEIGR